MSREKDPECRGLLLNKSDNAICVAPLHSRVGGESWWIPRSQIGYMRTDKNSDPHSPDYICFTCPEWLLEKKQAWALAP